MTPEHAEDLMIRALDSLITSGEQDALTQAIGRDQGLAENQSAHQHVRKLLIRKTPASFGYSFPSRLVARIEKSGVIIERQMFFFFKKYQLIAAGIVVALLVLNTILSDQLTLDSIFGLNNTQVEDIVSFDFYDTLNSNL